jgi:hypothetical protein
MSKSYVNNLESALNLLRRANVSIEQKGETYTEPILVQAAFDETQRTHNKSPTIVICPSESLDTYLSFTYTSSQFVNEESVKLGRLNSIHSDDTQLVKLFVPTAREAQFPSFLLYIHKIGADIDVSNSRLAKFESSFKYNSKTGIFTPAK